MLGVNHSIVKHNRAGTDALIRDYDFIRKDKLHQDIEFSRASGATQTNSSGLVAFARNNLHAHSTGVNATTFGGLNMEAHDANFATAPDGTTTAARARPTSATARHELYTFYDSVANSIYSSSIYVKPLGSITHISFTWAGSGSVKVVFDIVNGTAGSTGTDILGKSITHVGDGWMRMNIVFKAVHTGNTKNYISLGEADSSNSTYTNVAGDGTKGILYWGAQTEQILSAQDEPLELIHTDGAAYQAPRFDYTKDGDKKGLLIEEQRTNSIPYSQDFSNAEWTDGNTITSLASNITDPSGGNNSYKITQTTNPWDAINEFNLNLSTNTAYTFSVFIKKPIDGQTSLRLYDSANSTALGTVFHHWADGVPFKTDTTVGTAATPEDYGNGWYRLSITGTTDATNASNNYVQIMPDYDDTGEHCFVFGAQLEAGSFPSSLIPTYGSTAARSADIVKVDGTNFSRFFKDAEGTFAIDIQMPKGWKDAAFGYFFAATAGGNILHRINFYGRPSQNYLSGHIQGGSELDVNLSTNSTIALDGGEISRHAIAYKQDDGRYSGDGDVFTVTDTSVTLPVGINRLDIGQLYNGSQVMTGWFRRLRYFNKRKSDAQVQKLTDTSFLLDKYKGAKAAHSLRSLRDGRDNSPVTRIRREYDSFEADYTANQVANGDLEKDFRSADQTTLPLDVSVEADEMVSNGTFDSNTTGWTAGGGATLAVDNGRLKITNDSSGNSYAYQAISTRKGSQYTVSLDYTDDTGGNALIWAGTSVGGNQLGTKTFTTSGHYSLTFTATSGTSYLRIGANEPTSGTIYFFDNVSVKEVNPKASGYSCRKINSSYTGYAMRVRNNDDNIEAEVSFDSNNEISLDSPVKATSMNLIGSSENFDAWNDVNTDLTLGQSDPFGGNNATLFTPSGTGTDRKEILNSVTANQSYTASVYVKKGTSDNFGVQFVDHLDGYLNRGIVRADIDGSGNFSTTLDTGASNINYESVGNGFTRVSFTFIPPSSSTQVSMRLFPDRDNGTGTTIFYGAMLEETVYESIGTELVTNGDFSTSDSSANGIADWQTASGAGLPDDGTGTTLVNGKLRFDNSMATGTSSDFLQIFQRVDVVAGRKYSFSGDFDILDGTVSGGGVNAVLLEDGSPFASRVNFGPVTADGTVTGDHVATITETVRMRLDRRYVNGGTDNDVVADIDNISLVEYLPKVSDYTQTPVVSDAHNSTSATNLREFAGSADVKVVTWYNQGGGEDFTQITAGNQPKIVLAGSLVTDSGGKASVYFDTADHLDNDSLAGHNRLDSYYLTDSTDDIYALPAGNTGSYVGALFDDGGTSNNWYLSAYATSDSKIHINGTELSGTSRDNLHDQSKGHSLVTHENVYTKSWPNFEVGVWTAGSAYNFTGKISEMVFFPNMDSSPKRFPIEQNMIQHFMDGAIYSEDFNDGTGGWIDSEGGGSSTTLSHETTNPISGSGSLKITLSNTGTSTGYPRVRVFMGTDVRLNVKYRLSFKAKIISGTPRCDIRFGTSTLNMKFATQQAFSTTAQTYTFTETFDTLAGGSLDVLDFLFNGTRGPFELLIDDVKVEEVGVEGFVTTLYDQAGNNCHATQSTAAEQPQIVSGGDLIKSGNHPAWYYRDKSSGNDDVLSIPSLAGLSRLDAFFVHEVGSDTTFMYPTGSATGGHWGMLAQSSSSTNWQNYLSDDSSLVFVNGTQGSPTSRLEYLNLVNGRKLVHHQKGATTSWTHFNMSDYNLLGTSTNNPQDFKFSEWIWYDSDQSSNRTGIESNINTHYNIY